MYVYIFSRDGSRSKKFSGSGQPPLGLEISPCWKNTKIFNFFPSAQKNPVGLGQKNTKVKDGLASYLMRVKKGTANLFLYFGQTFILHNI